MKTKSHFLQKLSPHWWKVFSLILLVCMTSLGAYAQTTVTITCTGAPGSFKSGSVNVGGTKNDDAMVTINSGANRGWANYDLSGLGGATITAVTAEFTTYSTTLSGATNNVYGFTGDPSTMTGTALYTACASGTSLNASTWSANALQSKVLNASGIAFIQANIGGNANIGYVRGSTNTYNIYGYGGVTPPTLIITYTGGAPCAGTPTPGNTISSVASVCTATPFSLSLQNATSGSGVTYQWESADDNLFTVNQANLGTGPTQSATQSTPKYYRCHVTCSAGPSTGTSTPVLVGSTVGAACLVYCASGATSTADEEIGNVTFGTLNNTSVCGTLAPGPGSTASFYSNYRSGAGAPAAPIVSQLQSVPFSVSILQCNSGPYTNQFKIYIDYNQNGSFSDAGEEVASVSGAGAWTGTGNILIPLTATVGQTVMRVVDVEGTVAGPCGTYTWGETEDYMIEIVATSACVGTPTPGNTIASANPACPNTNVVLSLQNAPVTTGNTFQWYNNGGAIAGATNDTYTIVGFNAADDYYCDVTCNSPGGSTASSNLISLTVNNFLNCYCAANSSFGTSGLFYGVISNVTFNTLNQASSAPAASPYYTNYSPIGTSVDQGSPYPLSVSLPQYGQAAVWFDWNQNGQFGDQPDEFMFMGNNGTATPTTYTQMINVPLTAVGGVTRMRVRSEAYFYANLLITQSCGNTNYGETEDYELTVIIPSPCAGTPAPGNTTASATTVCPNTVVNFGLANTNNGTGITYQWFNNGGAIAGATNAFYSQAITVADDFYCELTCTNSSQVGSSNLISITLTPFFGCYCASNATQAFDEEILNVTVGSLNNTSTCATTGGPGSIINQYSDYTTVVTAPQYTQLQTVPLSIQIGTCGGNYSSSVSVWIDYDHSGTFDYPAENVFNTVAPNINGPYTATGSFLVPLSAMTGLTRMRVLNIEGGGTPMTSACGTYGYGETEDYLVEITPGEFCASYTRLLEEMATNPTIAQKRNEMEAFIQNFTDAGCARISNSVITIPVVFHVLHYGEPIGTGLNISDARIIEQIDQLNKDYSRMNSDAVNTPSAFQPLAANTRIQFCLAKRDPNCNPTNGILRKQSSGSPFSHNDLMKHNSSGGDDAWPSSDYLNIWTCDFYGGLFGFATFPFETTPDNEGVVLKYTIVGSMNLPGTQPPFDNGKIASHEVGHYFNLNHIFGDVSNCSGTDHVDDTPNALPNTGCPAFPHISCNNYPGDMFMNYMDYTYPNCWNMFTAGQSDRMYATFNFPNSPRASLLASAGCVPPTNNIGIWAQDTQEDVGDEPNTQSGEVMWASEDIWIRNSNDAGFIHQNPISNSMNYIYVRVRNSDCNAYTNTNGDQVKLNWAKASTGLQWPTDWDDVNPGVPAMGGAISPAQNIPNIPSGGSIILVFQWHAPDINNYQNIPEPWHFCLLAHIGTPSVTETSSVYENARNNSNIIWRNITIAHSPVGFVVRNSKNVSVIKKLEFKVPVNEIANNIFNVTNVHVRLNNTLYQLWAAGGKQGSGFIEQPNLTLKLLNSGATISNLNLPPNSFYRVVVNIDHIAPPLSQGVYNIDVLQFEGNQIMPDGGERIPITSCTLTTPEIPDLSPKPAYTHITCYGGNNGTISLDSGLYTNIMWSGPGSFASTNHDLNGLSSGTYTLTATDATSIVHTITITLNQPPSNTSTTVTACDYYVWPINGVMYTSSGTYTFNASCPLTYTLNLTVNYSTASPPTVINSCNPYIWPNNNMTYSISGIYTSTTLNSSGCVHTDSLNFTINNNCYCTANSSFGTSGLFYGVLTNVTFNALNNSSSAPTTSPYYTNYSPIGTLVDQGSPYPLSVTLPQYGQAAVWFDWNQNGLFGDQPDEFMFMGNNGTNISATFTQLINVPLTAVAGVTRMRVRTEAYFYTNLLITQSCGNTNYGETEDYELTVIVPTPCTGAPAPGATTASATSVCPGNVVNFGLSNINNGSGITYQWYHTSAAPVLIAGATNAFYSKAVSAADDFYCVLTCTNSSTSTSSTPIAIALNPFFGCYCTSQATTTADEEIFNVTVGSLNNTSTCATTGGPGSLINQYSDYTTIVTAPILTQGTTVPYSLQIGTCGGNFSSGCAIFIDFDHSGTFDAPEERVASSTGLINGPYTETGSFIIPLTSLTGLTRMRVLNIEQTALPVPSACVNYGYGETEDYVITIDPSVACSGAPAASTTLASVNPVCTGATTTLSLSTSYSASGITFQWYNGGGAIAGATNATHTATITAADNFYCDVTCTNSSLTTSSTPVAITLNTLFNCYCAAGATTGCANGDEYVGEVIFNTISNTSACGTSTYTNYTSISTNVSQGQTYTASVLIPNWFSGDQASVWIDFNHDGTLDDITERFDLLSGGGNGTTPLTGSVAIPLTALTGPTLMRVRGAYTGTYTACGNTSFGEVEDYLVVIDSAVTNTVLNLNLWIEGYWDGAGAMLPVLLNQGQPNTATECDNITVELISLATVLGGPPYTADFTTTAMLNTNGSATAVFTSAVSGDYYIVIKHRNALQTWSANPITFGGLPISYNFTSAITQAYGSNQTEVSPGVWAFFSGDVVNDENMDLLDLGNVEIDISEFIFGYSYYPFNTNYPGVIATDINGDGNVDILDSPAIEENIANFVFSIHP